MDTKDFIIKQISVFSENKPGRLAAIAKALEEYYRDNSKHKDLWQNVSEAGVSRVRENYTWKLYSSSLIKQTKLYGFWRFSVAEKGKEEMDRYSDVLYHFLFKERTKRLKH